MSSWEDLARNLERLAVVPSQISKPASDRINELLKEQFAQGKNPYGETWVPLMPKTIKKKGFSKVLIETGKLAASTEAVPMSGAGIELRSIDYGQFHQTGTKHMVAREVLPGGDELPLSWQDAISQAYSDRMNKWDRSGQ